MTAQQWRKIWRKFDASAIVCPYCGHGVTDDESNWQDVKQAIQGLVEDVAATVKLPQSTATSQREAKKARK